MPRIEVCLAPQLYDITADNSTVVVVVDILRATSAICTAIEHGAKKIIPVCTVEEAKKYLDGDYLVAAERNGEIVDGFEHGNSPYSFMGKQVKGRTIVLTTTNGTLAINKASNAFKVLIGSFINLTALTKWLAKDDHNIVFLCAGWKGRFNLEDSLFAGAVINLLAEYRDFDIMEDSALAARYLYEKAKDDPGKFLSHSSHRRRLARLDLKKDIKYCLTPDQSNTIPYLNNGIIVEMDNSLV